MALFSATMGTLASLATIDAGVAVVGSSVTSMISAGKAGKMPEMPQMPKTPTAEDSQKLAVEKDRARKAAMARSKSIYTSPLGVSGEADISRKTLLGQ